MRPKGVLARLDRLRTHLLHHARVVAVFGRSGDLWGAKHLRLPVAADLRALM